MPSFDRVPLREAEMKTASVKRARIIAEYVRYIEQLRAGSRQAKEKRSLPYDGDSVLPQGSRGGTLRSAEKVTGSIPGRRRRAGEGAEGHGQRGKGPPRSRL